MRVLTALASALLLQVGDFESLHARMKAAEAAYTQCIHTNADRLYRPSLNEAAVAAEVDAACDGPLNAYVDAVIASGESPLLPSAAAADVAAKVRAMYAKMRVTFAEMAVGLARIKREQRR